METQADTVCDYQVWTYEKDNNVITEHKCISDKCSQADAEGQLTEISRELIYRGVSHSIDKPQCTCKAPGIYIRRHGEPTYMIYNVFPGDRWVMYDLVYHKKEADRVLEILEQTTKRISEHGGPVIVPVMKERDDSEDRNERREPLASTVDTDIHTDDDLPELLELSDSDDENTQYVSDETHIRDMPELDDGETRMRGMHDMPELDDDESSDNGASDELLDLLIRYFNTRGDRA